MADGSKPMACAGVIAFPAAPERQRWRLEAELEHYRRAVHHLANYDALTGLPNRSLLSSSLPDALRAPPFGLMMLDLDHFREINDTLGHAAGDRLLCEAARRLQACALPGELIARFGGDEFAMLVPAGRAALAARATAFLAALDEPFVIDGRELFIHASIGIAVCPDDGNDSDTLCRHADAAMHHAKHEGRNHHEFYVRELTRQAAERLEMEAALRRACRNGELELHFQPQVDILGGRLVGAEALLRWNHPGHGMVMPQQFIPIAEASGLIVEIGEWVLDQACAAVAQWNRGRRQPLQLAVNLSPRQFVRNDLAGAVQCRMRRSGCQPSWLKLEITESMLLDGDGTVASVLAALTGMGLAISIDDFGTGYSALSYLHRFPVSQLKIDRSFVSGVPDEQGKSELVKAMLSIAAALRLETVAEGVESRRQADYLAQLGCRHAQGYLYGKPMPRAGFEALLAANHAQ